MLGSASARDDMAVKSPIPLTEQPVPGGVNGAASYEAHGPRPYDALLPPSFLIAIPLSLGVLEVSLGPGLPNGKFARNSNGLFKSAEKAWRNESICTCIAGIGHAAEHLSSIRICLAK